MRESRKRSREPGSDWLCEKPGSKKFIKGCVAFQETTHRLVLWRMRAPRVILEALPKELEQGAAQTSDAISQLQKYKDELEEASKRVKRQKTCMEAHTRDARDMLGVESKEFNTINDAAGKILDDIRDMANQTQSALVQVSALLLPVVGKPVGKPVEIPEGRQAMGF